MSSSRTWGRAMASPPPSDGHIPSSPSTMMPPSSPIQEGSSRKRPRRERREPTITPRKFRRFFTPRSERLAIAFDARSILGESSESTLNAAHLTSPASTLEDKLDSRSVDSHVDASQDARRKTLNLFGGSIDYNNASRREPGETFPDARKRRRTEASDLLSSPSIGSVRTSDLTAHNLRALGAQTRSSSTLGFESKLAQSSHAGSNDAMMHDYKPKPVMKLRNRGFAAQLLLREQGITPRPGLERIDCPAHDQRSETTRFFTRDTDVYTCTSSLGRGHTIPFSLASCHTTPLTAVGDEEGFIRLFDTKSVPVHVSEPTKVKIAVQAHNNAIMDLAFSHNDLRLATACGDHSGKIMDVMSQSIAVELNHGQYQAMRRVKFQPGQANGDVLATSDRDGTIQIWDIRCSTSPAVSFTTMGPRGPIARDRDLPPSRTRPLNTMLEAHVRVVEGETRGASVTALEWLPAGREHLLLSASEANSCIKLWDTRYVTSSNRAATPLSATATPSTHAWRPYGLTSMCLSSDASRLYAVCKDSTVYAYSTAHLMLGPAPQLSRNPPRQKLGSASPGLGPLYGFRHPALTVGSFYVRSALRTVGTGNGPELLAVGSATSSAILFPTDERFLREKWDRESHDPNHDWDASARRPGPSSGAAAAARIPIVHNGTQLADGHQREVTGLSWSNEGKLVTVSDDYTVRHWQEDACEGAGDRTEDVPRDARDLRTCGGFGRKRWMAGWARTEEGASWDDDDDDHSEC
ncbi:hypothetical protein BN1708_005710 [Verticillium longisporum]|uniref:Uncharacterized protein n=2 Tax=Verticillium longisporum TaxID=100787 RepID=A0A0G4MDG0_VERLO|nr:hypothetical protein BN1708_005710 [Verticillium longisporum]